MNSRWSYICITVLLLITVGLLSRISITDTTRVHQHLQENHLVEDTNLSIDPETFSSHLPVIDIHTDNEVILASIRIIDQEDKLNSLQDKETVSSFIYLKEHGDFSENYGKCSYLFSIVDANGEKLKKEIIGMESNSDWLLQGPFLDKTLIRNYMWYNFSGQLMEWAPDVRFCEVFINNLYQGVYILTENIDIGEGRLEITEFRNGYINTGYLLNYNQTTENTKNRLNSFTDYTVHKSNVSYPMAIEVLYPSDIALSSDVIKFIKDDFSAFEKTLHSYDYNSKKYGYSTYIDVENFVDYFLLNEISMNIGDGTHSIYFYKDINSKIKMCVSDFSNCCNNSLDSSFTTEGFIMRTSTWYKMLCKDPYFTEKIIERYRKIRKSYFSDEHVQAYIQNVQDYLGCAIYRNYQVWDFMLRSEDDLLLKEHTIDSYETAIKQYETFLLDRLQWLDENIEALRVYSNESVNKKYNK